MTSVGPGEAERPIVFHDQLDPPIERETSMFFEVDQAEVLLICPSLDRGAKALEACTQAGRQSVADAEGNEPEKSDKQASSRKLIREIVRMYGNHMQRLISTGARLAESYDDTEEGARAGREILTKATGEVLVFLWDDFVAPEVEPLRNLRSASQEIAAEMAATAGDTNKRYILLKTLSLDYGTERQHEIESKLSNATDWRPAKALTVLSAFAESPIRSELTAELNEGVFDKLIARDILQFMEENNADTPDFVKVQELVRFMKAFTGVSKEDKPAFYESMVARLADWPPDQLQAIIDARQQLQDTLGANFGRAANILREKGMTGKEDLAAAFENSIDKLATEFFKRLPAAGSDKAAIVSIRAQLRTKRKKIKTKPKKKKDRTIVPAEEGPREPLKLLTCNLNDHTTTEGVAGLVDSFVERASQGDITIREELERMTHYMARTDLPPTHRRGIYALPNIKVRFGEDGKLWDLYEFKPTDAAGLTLRTDATKDSRIYFIKLPDQTLGIVGIESRSNQEAFLKSIRVKQKRRG